MNNVTIRPLTADDLTSAKGVIESTGLFPGEMLDDIAAPFLTGIAPDDLWFVTADARVVQGLVYCVLERMTDRTWNLLLIAVREGEQGKGVGSRLTRHLERTLSQRSGRVLSVETSGLPDFDRTRAVYESLDYVEVARIPQFYAAGEGQSRLLEAGAPVASGRGGAAALPDHSREWPARTRVLTELSL